MNILIDCLAIAAGVYLVVVLAAYVLTSRTPLEKLTSDFEDRQR